MVIGRYQKALALAVAVHLLGAVALGYVNFRVNRTPPHIMEVTLAGGGNGAPAAGVAVPSAATVAQDKDAITDKKLKATETEQSPAKENAAQQGSGTKESNGSGSGTGGQGQNGEGTGQGEGKGAGSGEKGGNAQAERPAVPPRLVYNTNPRYPLSVRSRNITGTTQVRMLVNSKGKVENASVAASSGNQELDQAAVECVYKWRFSAAKDKMGKAVPCYITVPIRFTINK